MVPSDFFLHPAEPEPADYTPQFFVRVRISLSTSLYIHFSPILSVTCLNKQTNKQRNSTIPLNVNKITVHQISKGILWPVSGIHCFKKSSSLSPQVAKTSSYRRETFKMQYSQIQQEIYFPILNVKITCIIIQYFKVTKIF